MYATERVSNAEHDVVTGDKLMADLRFAAADMERLLKATAGQTGQYVAQVRARAAESLKASITRGAEMQQVAMARTRTAGRPPDFDVRADPWQAVAIGAIVGLVLGAHLSSCGTHE